MEIYLTFTPTGRLKAASRHTLRDTGRHYCRACNTVRLVDVFYRRSDGAPLDACKTCHKGRVTAAKAARARLAVAAGLVEPQSGGRN
jgi:hypothetical protein